VQVRRHGVSSSSVVFFFVSFVFGPTPATRIFQIIIDGTSRGLKPTTYPVAPKPENQPIKQFRPGTTKFGANQITGFCQELRDWPPKSKEFPDFVGAELDSSLGFRWGKVSFFSIPSCKALSLTHVLNFVFQKQQLY